MGSLQKFDILQYIDSTNKAKTVEEAFRCLESALASIGIDRVVYSLMTDHNTINKKAGHAILGNYPEDWMKYYRQKTYEDIDPVRKHIMVADGPFAWSALEKFRGYADDEEVLMRQAEDAKLLDGIGLSIHGPRGEVVGMGFASSSGGVDVSPATLSLVQLLSFQFHNVFRALESDPNYKPEFIRLTPREGEVLKWIARGKSYPDIGEILALSERTVKFHAHNAFHKLDASDHRLAIVKAIRLGLILP